MSGTPAEGIEADRPLDVGGVDVDEIVGAVISGCGRAPLGEVAVRIEKRNALPGGKVLANEIEQASVLLPVPVCPTM